MSFSAFLAISFAISVASVLVVVGLFSAPWQILLLFLVAVLVATDRFLKTSQNQTRFSEIESSETVDSSSVKSAESDSSVQDAVETSKVLQYRGGSYHPASASAESDNSSAATMTSGKYRGSIWRSLNR